MKGKCNELLVTIRRSEVPLYLQSSELYLSFSDESDDDEICVPSNCLKKTAAVNSRSDLEHMLATVRFWILWPFPHEMVEYIANVSNPGVKELVPEYKDAFPNLHSLVDELVRYPCKHFSRLAAKHGCVEFLEYFAEQRKLLDSDTLQIAAENGHADCLLYCFQFLERANDKIHLNSINWDKVVKSGNVDCLIVLTQHGWIPNEGYCRFAAAAGQLACWQYLFRLCPDRSSHVTESAARGDHLSCLKYLIEQGCEVTLTTWEAAMVPTDPITTATAASDDSHRLCCLSYLLDTVPPPAGKLTLIRAAISSRNTDAMHLLYRRGYCYGQKLGRYAAKTGSFECLKFLHDVLHVHCWVTSTMAAAAGAGHLELVQKLHEMGCPWDESAPTAALRADEADCLHYLFQQRGVPTCSAFTSITPNIRCSIVLVQYQINQLHVWIRKLEQNMK